MLNQLTLDDEARETFAREGALPLRGLFSPEALELLRGLIDQRLEEGQVHGDLFRRAGYDFANDDPALLSLVGQPSFGALLNGLTRRQLLFSQSVAFELQPGDAGFKWHLGFVSYKYIHQEDYGCTLWVPLAPIRPQEQAGGMSYVRSSFMSGRERAKFIAGTLSHPDSLELLPHLGQAYPGERNILEHVKVEESFDLGDALLFDRFVFHRSEVLRPGPIASRAAFVFRFVDAEARFSRAVLEMLVPGGKTSSRFREQFQGVEDLTPLSALPQFFAPIGARSAG